MITVARPPHAPLCARSSNAFESRVSSQQSLMSLSYRKLYTSFRVVSPSRVGSCATARGVPLNRIPLCYVSSIFVYRSFLSRHGPVKTFRNSSTKARHSDVLENKNVTDFDMLLLRAEAICLFSSAVLVISHAVICTFSEAKKTLFGAILGTPSALAWGVAALAATVATGAWIRRREGTASIDLAVGEGMHLSRRVAKLEEELKSSVTVIRVLSRQLEKLGIRFRVTRKVLKGPIAETAALAQKNSEATRALAFQEEILEKELGEMQRVLLAMQEQQQRQLELILAIGSAESFSQPELEETKQEPESIQSFEYNSGVQTESRVHQALDESE